ncbi:MAG TPA: hypothetical protein VJJ83_01355 [Candidatus Babeliales bacterium]|nr:hypothetical protein [Candidatus Babeliales bacterium]
MLINKLLLSLLITGLTINCTNFAAETGAGAGAQASAHGGNANENSSWTAKFSELWIRMFPNHSLKSAIENGDLLGVQKALRLGANANYIVENCNSNNNYCYTTPRSKGSTYDFTEPILTYCVRLYPNQAIIMALLAAGANLANQVMRITKDTRGYVTSKQSCGSLFFSIRQIDEQSFSTLINQDLTPEVRNQALLQACRLGYANAAQRLIAAGADVNHVYENCTTFGSAIINHHTAIVELLLSYDAAINQQNIAYAEAPDSLMGYWHDWVLTPLQLAVKLDQLDTIKLLLKAGADVKQSIVSLQHHLNAVFPSQGYSLVAAAKSVTALNLLIMAGADINGCSSMNDYLVTEPKDKELIKTLILAGAKVMREAYIYNNTVAEAVKEISRNTSHLQKNAVSYNIQQVMAMIRRGVTSAGLLVYLQQLVTELQSDAIYEIIDSLALNHVDLKLKDHLNQSALDCAILANNYKAVDALLLHGLGDHDPESGTTKDLHADTMANLLAATTIEQSKATDDGLEDPTIHLEIDLHGNVLHRGQKIAEIANWAAAVAPSASTAGDAHEQLCLPNLRVASLNRTWAHSMEVDESKVLAHAKAILIAKLLGDKEMAQSNAAALATTGHDTGFATSSVPIRYTASKRQTILENMRMQYAERDSLATGSLSPIAATVNTDIYTNPEAGVEMVAMSDGRKRYKHLDDSDQD